MSQLSAPADGPHPVTGHYNSLVTRLLLCFTSGTKPSVTNQTVSRVLELSRSAKLMMASPAAAASFPAIILFGDSLIEQAYSPGRDGSGATLADAYVRRADVLNRGLSGYNSDWLLPWLERVLAAQISEVLLWVVWVGTNDACLPEFVHHVPLERYKENICKMIKMIRENERSQHSRILFITPPPIDREMLGKYHRRKGADRSFDVTAEYAAAVKDLILDLGTDDSHLGVLDFYTVFMKKVANAPLNDEGSPSLREYLTDGLHLGPKGYQLLYGAFMVHVENHWPEILPKNIPLMAPWAGDLEVVKEFERKKRAENHDEL